MNDTSPVRKIQISQPSLGEEEWEALRGPILSGWLTHGPRVTEFEKAFAARHGVKHAIATTSCTTALHLILAGMGIGPGDEVLVPAFTWVATANVVAHLGATPVLVDIDRKTFNIDPKLLAARRSSKTKAVIVVHLFGLCADVDAVKEALPDIPIIEDAACAAGASFKGKPAGGLGFAGAFSFHPRKSITTGEGGMVTTDDDDLADRLISLRNHGASISEEERHNGPKPYLLPEFNLLGFNYRMTDLQGAVGLVQLSKLDQFIQERQRWATFYADNLAPLHWLRTPTVGPDSSHAWQAYVCYVDPNTAPRPRNEIMDSLHKKGVSTRPGTHAVHMLGYYQRRYGYRDGDFPAARDCDQQTLAIPLHNKMTREDFQHVVSVLQEVG